MDERDATKNDFATTLNELANVTKERDELRLAIDEKNGKIAEQIKLNNDLNEKISSLSNSKNKLELENEKLKMTITKLEDDSRQQRMKILEMEFANSSLDKHKDEITELEDNLKEFVMT